MASKFNVVITVFKTFRRQISILNTKYYESPFEKLKVRKNDIMIIKLSKYNSNKSKASFFSQKDFKFFKNKYYNLESIFEKLILCI